MHDVLKCQIGDESGHVVRHGVSHTRAHTHTHTHTLECHLRWSLGGDISLCTISVSDFSVRDGFNQLLLPMINMILHHQSC